MRTGRLHKASKRRRQVFLKKLSIVFATFLIASGFGIMTGSNAVSAHDKVQNITVEQKCYKSIEIASGDTLWDIAEDHTDGNTETVQEYVEEIKAINGLLDDDIHEGQFLTVPYYNHEA